MQNKYFNIPDSGSKIEKYIEVLKETESIISGEENFIANLANISSLLKMFFQEFSWVGFYLRNKNILILGPFQGKPACTRIKFGKGVCGTAFKKRKAFFVNDVSKFPGHIYCDPNSKSEIVIPMIFKGKFIGVLDIDSYELNNFDEIDKLYLTNIVNIILEHQYGRKKSKK